ncbi:MAG: tyrosine-type recombinase/integrase [bacterium]|nr:tyrosine-type recombinase/integrase [bacterium]
MSTLKRKSKSKGKINWWVDFMFNRTRYRKSSPENSKQGAMAYESVLRQRLALGQDINLKPEVKDKQKTFAEYAWEWFDSYAVVNNKPTEIKNKRQNLRKYLVPYFGKKSLNEIYYKDIEEFKAKQLGLNLKPKTINNQIGCLMKCLKTAQEQEITEKIPLFKPLKVAPQKFDYLSQDEADKLLGAAIGVYRSAILIALHTGMRFGELMALSWEDINFISKTITVRRSFSLNVLGSTKSNRIRYIPMTEDLYQYLLPLPDKQGFVLKGREKTRLRPSYSRDVLHLICQNAGIRIVGWHTLRHSFASRLAEAGVSMIVIKELLGHSDIKTTMIYAHLGPLALKESIKVLESNQAKTINICHNSVTLDDSNNLKREKIVIKKINLTP